ncbi:MAG: hypothetical protein AB7P04_11410, partial [Bacteriovoracia bacterium]
GMPDPTLGTSCSTEVVKVYQDLKDAEQRVEQALGRYQNLQNKPAAQLKRLETSQRIQFDRKRNEIAATNLMEAASQIEPLNAAAEKLATHGEKPCAVYNPNTSTSIVVKVGKVSQSAKARAGQLKPLLDPIGEIYLKSKDAGCGVSLEQGPVCDGAASPEQTEARRALPAFVNEQAKKALAAVPTSADDQFAAEVKALYLVRFLEKMRDRTQAGVAAVSEYEF